MAGREVRCHRLLMLKKNKSQLPLAVLTLAVKMQFRADRSLPGIA